ncbi:MAG: hypothetical protein KGM42_16270, partial [Hyphomicrobiales bacterium]|nr:hypothetical protein [Hyphomicrobiales bacterium]
LGAAQGYAITSPRRFGAMLRASAAARLADDASRSVHALEPRLSALNGPGRGEQFAAGLVALGCLAAGLIAPQGFAAVLWLLLAVSFIAATLTRLFVTAASFDPEPEAPPLADPDLPDYTVVVALYHEASVASALVRALEKIDYPGIMAQTPQELNRLRA